MEKTIRTVFYFGPILFGLGFLAPLIAQSMVRFWQPEFLGIAALYWGLIIGGGYGLITQITGRWL